MAQKVIVTMQGVSDGKATDIKKEIIVSDDFELFDDYYAYQIGAKKNSGGNDVTGAMIGDKYYVRFIDVIDIIVEEMQEEPPIETKPEQFPNFPEEVMPDE